VVAARSASVVSVSCGLVFASVDVEEHRTAGPIYRFLGRLCGTDSRAWFGDWSAGTVLDLVRVLGRNIDRPSYKRTTARRANGEKMSLARGGALKKLKANIAMFFISG
jgi:hypothetical protein